MVSQRVLNSVRCTCLLSEHTIGVNHPWVLVRIWLYLQDFPRSRWSLNELGGVKAVSACISVINLLGVKTVFELLVPLSIILNKIYRQISPNTIRDHLVLDIVRASSESSEYFESKNILKCPSDLINIWFKSSNMQKYVNIVKKRAWVKT